MLNLHCREMWSRWRPSSDWEPQHRWVETRGERWSVRSECSGLTQPRLTPSLCRTQGSRDGVGGAGCHWALSWAKCPNAVHLRPFPHLDYFQLRFIADDKKILISRLMTTLARAEHRSIQFQIPGRGKFQGDTHRAPRPVRGRHSESE